MVIGHLDLIVLVLLVRLLSITVGRNLHVRFLRFSILCIKNRRKVKYHLGSFRHYLIYLLQISFHFVRFSALENPLFFLSYGSNQNMTI